MLKKVLKQFFQDKRSLFLVYTRNKRSLFFQKKLNLYLTIAFLLGLSLRLFWLDRFPPGILHDELNYIMNAKSLWMTGKNIPLTNSGLFSWNSTDIGVVISELPSLLISTFVGLGKLNFINSRLPYALISSLTILVFYKLVSIITRNEKVGLIASFLLAINPWSFFFGRTAFEINFAVFFYLTGLWLFLRFEGWKIFYALPLFLAGFLSYIGGKVLFLPLMVVVSLYKYFVGNRSKNKKPVIIFLTISFLLVLLFFLGLKLQPTGMRMGELIFFNKEWSASLVNDGRRLSVANNFNWIFINKLTVSLKRIADVYLESFSSSILFTKGEHFIAYSLLEHGLFYLVDFIFLIIGVISMYNRDRRAFWFVTSIIAISPMVASVVILDQAYSVRAAIMYFFLLIFISFGVWRAIEKVKSRKFNVSILFVYLFFMINLLHLYFYRYPVYAADGWFVDERIVSNYVYRVREVTDVNITVVVGEPKIVFEEYLYYSGLYEDKENITIINSKIRENNFSFENVSFVNICPERIVDNDILVSESRFPCAKEEFGKLGIVSLKDAGTRFVIENDLLCKEYQLPRYYRIENFAQFDMENMTSVEFCQNWIVRF